MLVVDYNGAEGAWSGAEIIGLLSKLGACASLAPNLDEGRRILSGGPIRCLTLRNWDASPAAVEFLTRSRSDFPALTIQVVGRDNEPAHIASAYDSGSDHFIRSDCSPQEMEARLRQILSGSTPSSTDVSVDDLQVWRDSRIAFRAGTPIQLSGKEMEILRYMVARKNQAVSRAELLEKVFGIAHDPGTNIVEVHIHRLRRKIDSGQSHKLLTTIRGTGYVLG
ncbi:winged helix family transcriptional regulator [Ahrensia sp. R2A130]|uniref:winged helix family transcriptional regulator n=1 Tax=Ahrensia sp. R2A130 TaxID=744979 RepID=UPI0001E094AE|nr:response regulator transcription factor [Ahrensia sp. R2A130]EFL88149.1 two component transcriptional regulator [Ahrensia sp. R2A130]